MSEGNCFTIHMTTNSGERVYKYDFNNSTDGQVPLKKQISGGNEKCYKCDHCSGVFPHKSQLIRHLRIHTGEKPYKCKLCDKSFTNSSHLTRHVRVHTGERPYGCKFCKKTFSQSSHLTTHMKIHNRYNLPSKICLRKKKTQIHASERISKQFSQNLAKNMSGYTAADRSRSQKMNIFDKSVLEIANFRKEVQTLQQNRAMVKSNKQKKGRKSFWKLNNFKRRKRCAEQKGSGEPEENCKDFATSSKKRLSDHSLLGKRQARKIALNSAADKLLSDSSISSQKTSNAEKTSFKFECCGEVFLTSNGLAQHIRLHKTNI